MSVYDAVTERIIKELEQGTVPWIKPWKTTLPHNAVSQREYSGVNILLLWYAPYGESAWLTYKQAQGLGGYVKKGEKATPIVYASTYTKKGVDSAGEATEEAAPFLKWYYVFNLDQCEGLPERLYHKAESSTDEAYSHVETFVGKVGATIEHGGNRACFIPSADLIRLPHLRDFESLAHYFATSLHEHAHWSGHPSRLNRNLIGRFGDESYAAEELIAEMTGAFLCAHLGIEGKLQHADYVASWLRVLKKDKRAVFTAARKATEASEYLRSFSREEETHA